MIFVFPYSHEDMTVRKYPVWTISIIAICFFMYIVVSIDSYRCQKQVHIKLVELYQFYQEHPYLDIPEEFYNEFPQLRHAMQDFKRTPFYKLFEREDKKTDDSVEEQERLNIMVKEAIGLRHKMIIHKYGYVPSRGFHLITLITYGFLHWGFFHMITNMMLLWLTGCVIEDKLGRVYFPIFYILAVIISGLTHSAFATGNMIYTPLIGASGGIAGLMGAFLIKMARTKIKLFYLFFFFLIIRTGTFQLPAYMVLPFWFILQLLQGLIQIHAPISNIAFWAHVGGFIFGFGVYLFLKYSKIDEKHITAKLDAEDVIFDEDLLKALEYIDSGQKDLAMPMLRDLVKKSPDPVIRTELAKLYLEQNDPEKAYKYANEAVSILTRKGLDHIILNFYTELREISRDFLPEPKHLLNIASLLRKSGSEAAVEEAKDLYKRLFQVDKSSFLAVKSVLGYADILNRYEKNAEEARVFLKKAMSHFRNNPDALDEIKAYYNTL